MILERMTPEYASEAFNRDDESVLDQVEDMRDEHISEAPDRSADTGVDQAPEGLNSLVLEFRSQLESADLDNQEQIDELNKLISEVAEIDESQAETLKQEFMN